MRLPFAKAAFRAAALTSATLALAAPARAQDTAPVYQEPKKVRFTIEALARYEWTEDFVAGTNLIPSDDRFVSWAFPGLEANLGKFQLGVAGGFYWSDQKNYEPMPTPQRDNFKSRDARLDRAFAKFDTTWLRLEAGRFTMPIAFTEMIWDKELKPQGGTLWLGVQDRGSLKSFGVTALYAKGSHVFEDQTEMYAASAEAVFAVGMDGSAQLVGSYVEFRNLDEVQPFLRRQNSRATPNGLIGREYKVVDGVIRLRRGGALPLQLVGNYCWNTAADTDNQGLWLAAAIGSLRSSRVRLDYTYAKVDRDATLGEYAADDFIWTTGWEGHRADLGLRLEGRGRATLHGIAQWQRFKDGPTPAIREDWVQRFRVELRIAN